MITAKCQPIIESFWRNNLNTLTICVGIGQIHMVLYLVLLQNCHRSRHRTELLPRVLIGRDQ